ncbi:MAG TPA: alanine racemase [Lachnospiraceae bacterium]|nr:alanine racemase [Lachnospiraceae bacterium]
MNKERVCAYIDLNNLRHNIEEIHRCNPNADIMCVIKADAYGHGSIEFAKILEEYDYVYGFAVATSDEGIELRINGISKPILVLGYTFKSSYHSMITYSIMPTIISYDMAKDFDDECKKMGCSINVHIKIDTGMGRIGFRDNEDDLNEISRINELSNIKLQGIFTHFAKADEKDLSYARKQLDTFHDVINKLSDKGICFDIIHAANSASIIQFKEASFDMVRAGIILYGLWPSDEVSHLVDIRPIMSIKSHVVYVKEIEKGDSISYGGTFIAPERMKVATIPVGYGDGYSRGLSNKGYVLINGHKADIIGRVCMDQFMVDVTGIDVNVLDEVTLLGTEGDYTITMEELGDMSGRFNYEFACDIGKRIPRVYVQDRS